MFNYFIFHSHVFVATNVCLLEFVIHLSFTFVPLVLLFEVNQNVIVICFMQMYCASWCNGC